MSQRLSRIALPVLTVSSRASSSRSRSISAAVRSRVAARSPVGRRGQSVVSNARRAAAIASWTWPSVATSTSVMTVASDGLTTGLQVPSAAATHCAVDEEVWHDSIPQHVRGRGHPRMTGASRGRQVSGSALRSPTGETVDASARSSSASVLPRPSAGPSPSGAFGLPQGIPDVCGRIHDRGEVHGARETGLVQRRGERI